MKAILKKIYYLIPFKKNLFILLRFLHLPKNIYQHLHFKGVFTIKFDRYSFKIRHYGYQIENELFWSGITHGWEKISMRTWIDLCRQSTCIIDIGANTGVYSLVAKSINSKAQVYAFEPVTRVYQKLVSNNSLNHYDIHCYEEAISNKDGTAIIYDTPTEHVYSVTVNKNLNSNPDAVLLETPIKTKKLSTFIREKKINHIDLIKIDVETHEPEVLEGLEEYLDAFKPTLLIEILNEEVGRKVEALVQGMGYLYFNIDENNPPRAVSSITKSDYYNYLICRKEIAQYLRLVS